MNTESLIFLAAAGLTIATVIVHSTLGERLIFRRLRKGPSLPGSTPCLNARQIGILWASWHIVSLFGLALADGLICLADPAELALPTVFRNAVVVTMLGGAALVAIGTRGRHPGWIAMLSVAALTAWA